MVTIRLKLKPVAPKLIMVLATNASLRSTEEPVNVGRNENRSAYEINIKYSQVSFIITFAYSKKRF